MAWVKLDDQFPDHPKVVSAGPLAAWLYVCGLTYANRHLTDGFIPAGVVSRLADLKTPTKLASTLVAVGLWELAEGGYRIHDYLTYQPSADRVRHERDSNAARQDAWRHRRNGVTNNTHNAITNEGVTGAPYPDPVRTQPNELSTSRGKGGAGGNSASDSSPAAPPRVRPAPKPEPKRDRFRETLDAVKSLDPDIVIGGDRSRNAKAVNEAMAEPALIAEAYVALMRGEWQDHIVAKQGSLHAVVDNIGGYVNSKRPGGTGRSNGYHANAPPSSAALADREERSRLGQQLLEKTAKQYGLISPGEDRNDAAD